MKAFLERWLEARADEVEEVQEKEAGHSVSCESATAVQAEAKALPVRVLDDEVAWRLEAFRQQLPEHGPIPFLVAREAVEPQAGCCLSCGDPLKQGDAYRCASCSRAANLALELSLYRAKAPGTNLVN